jgi:hypothetical protein
MKKIAILGIVLALLLLFTASSLAYSGSYYNYQNYPSYFYDDYSNNGNYHYSPSYQGRYYHYNVYGSPTYSSSVGTPKYSTYRVYSSHYTQNAQYYNSGSSYRSSNSQPYRAVYHLI